MPCAAFAVFLLDYMFYYVYFFMIVVFQRQGVSLLSGT